MLGNIISVICYASILLSMIYVLFFRKDHLLEEYKRLLKEEKRKCEQSKVVQIQTK